MQQSKKRGNELFSLFSSKRETVKDDLALLKAGMD